MLANIFYPKGLYTIEVFGHEDGFGLITKSF